MSVAREKRIQEAMAEAMKRMADLEAENAKLRERIERMDLEMQVEIATLNEKIEQLELLESRSAAEADRERKRAEFWRAECEQRAEFLRFCERGGSDTFGAGVCPECGQKSGHDADCPMPSLMTMPEEPKL